MYCPLYEFHKKKLCLRAATFLKKRPRYRFFMDFTKLVKENSFAERIWATASVNTLNVRTMKPSHTALIFFLIDICKIQPTRKNGCC